MLLFGGGKQTFSNISFCFTVGSKQHTPNQSGHQYQKILELFCSNSKTIYRISKLLANVLANYLEIILDSYCALTVHISLLTQWDSTVIYAINHTYSLSFLLWQVKISAVNRGLLTVLVVNRCGLMKSTHRRQGKKTWKCRSFVS